MVKNACMALASIVEASGKLFYCVGFVCIKLWY